ncbi:hypothetical protein E2C01_079524 [Portunus trituberculatus]|uniref:Uncharacterized protein n=1 Tax=Portunus trituberculatus TaxID=210409 RepID=A0A5B7IQJ6_PORTR|nr:hypothetical protein [Portunus trituberculatus]
MGPLEADHFPDSCSSWRPWRLFVVSGAGPQRWEGMEGGRPYRGRLWGKAGYRGRGGKEQTHAHSLSLQVLLKLYIHFASEAAGDVTCAPGLSLCLSRPLSPLLSRGTASG